MLKIQTDTTGWTIRFISVVLPVLFLIVIVFQPWVDPKWMFLDSLTSAEFAPQCCPPYFGFVSTLGIMLWVITATVCLFSALIIYGSKQHSHLFKFALSGGILTGWLALDDAFLLHEKVLPAFGVPQNIVLAIYVLLTLAYVLASWRAILTSDYWILAFGGLAFIASLFIDVYFSSLNPLLVSLEDSAKFLGIFCWASFHITTFSRAILVKEDPPAIIGDAQYE